MEILQNHAENPPETPENSLKTCLKCGIPQLLERFPFRKAEQKHRNTCKACRAAESHALRRDTEHGPLIRERERQRSQRRRPAIRAWERAHPDQMRPGRQRRWARRKAKLRRATYRPLLGPFRAVYPPPAQLPAPAKAQSNPRRG